MVRRRRRTRSQARMGQRTKRRPTEMTVNSFISWHERYRVRIDIKFNSIDKGDRRERKNTNTMRPTHKWTHLQINDEWLEWNTLPSMITINYLLKWNVACNILSSFTHKTPYADRLFDKKNRTKNLSIIRFTFARFDYKLSCTLAGVSVGSLVLRLWYWLNAI